MQSIVILRRKPRHYTQIGLKPHSFPIFLSDYACTFMLYSFLVPTFLHGSSTWQLQKVTLLSGKYPVTWPMHVVKLSNLNFVLEDPVDDLSTSLTCMLNRHVTCWLLCLIFYRFNFNVSHRRVNGRTSEHVRQRTNISLTTWCTKERIRRPWQRRHQNKRSDQVLLP